MLVRQSRRAKNRTRQPRQGALEAAQNVGGRAARFLPPKELLNYFFSELKLQLSHSLLSQKRKVFPPASEPQSLWGEADLRFLCCYCNQTSLYTLRDHG